MNPRERERRFSALKTMGCIACKVRGIYTSEVEIHHLNTCGQAGRKRRGDAYTVPLCVYHHQGRANPGASLKACQALLGPSLARESKRFREEIGNDEMLLELTNMYVAQRIRMNVRFCQ